MRRPVRAPAAPQPGDHPGILRADLPEDGARLAQQIDEFLGLRAWVAARVAVNEHVAIRVVQPGEDFRQVGV